MINKEQAKDVTEYLAEFVKRVSTDKNATPAELAALPGVAEILIKTNLNLMMSL